MDTILIIGYGNPDRQDDGIAWHVLNRLSGRLNRATDFDTDFNFECLTEKCNENPCLLFVLQLTPELSETIQIFDRVCFIDTHTGYITDDIQITEIKSIYEASPLSHHMTPASCMALCKSLFYKEPSTILVSIRGFEFGFSRELTPQVNILVDRVVDWIISWLVNPLIQTIK